MHAAQHRTRTHLRWRCAIRGAWGRLGLPLVAGLCAAFVGLPSAIQAQPAAVADRRPGAWFTAVRAHEPGRPDASLVAVASWTPEEVARVIPSVAGERDAPRLLEKALVLHTDIAIVEREGGAGLGQSERGMAVMMLEDGRQVGSRRLSVHWRIGRMIAGFLVALPPAIGPGNEPPTRDQIERERLARLRVVRNWYRASGALIQEWADCGLLFTHVQEGLTLLKGDPVLTLYRATLHQAYADPRIQQYARRTDWRRLGVGVVRLNDGRPVPATSAFPERPEIELELAADDLLRVIELDPQLVEARIRLAHVRSAQGRHEDAAALIRPALASPLPAFLEYYGRLVLGRSEERLGRLPEARAAFERAAALSPDAQAPRIALSRLALLQGRATEALAGLLESARASVQEPEDDPWWWYFRRHEPDAGTLIGAVRASAK